MFLKPKLTKANAAPMNGTSVEKISLQLGLSSSRCTEVRHFRRVRLDGSLIAQSRRERGRLVVARSQGAGFNFSLSCPVFRRLFVLQSMQRYLARRTAVIQKKFDHGSSDKSISTVDADGVALAAIQGLYQAMQDENALLRARLSALERHQASAQ